MEAAPFFKTGSEWKCPALKAAAQVSRPSQHCARPFQAMMVVPIKMCFEHIGEGHSLLTAKSAFFLDAARQ